MSLRRDDDDGHVQVQRLGAQRFGGPLNGGGGVKYRMLHIPGILDCTYHLHVSVSVCSRFWRSRVQLACCKRRHLRACVPVRFARVHTPKLHLNVVAELPGIPGVLHICEGDRGIPPVYFTFVERPGGIQSRGSIQGQRNG